MDRETEGLDDEQGTRVGAPDQTRTPAKHSDSPPDRPERKLGAGAEATAATDETADEHRNEHSSGYGGDGGAPKTSSDKR